MTDLIGKTLNRLGQRLGGRLSMPGEERYAAATAIWAEPAGRVPRAVVHSRTPHDVQLAIEAAHECGVPLSVRGGGHDWAGRALCDGIVIDLREMNSVIVGSENRTARVGGGARASDVVAVTDPLGVAPVTGSVGAVGMAGLTLGGGYGPLIGRFGLALDNLLAAEVVLADGRVVVAAPDKEEELFWALRGGGGNFGVVTAMRLRVHDLPSVRSGLLIYPFAEAETVLESYADIAAFMPDELTAQVGCASGGDGSPVVFIVPTWCGRPELGERWAAPFYRLGTLLDGSMDQMAYGTSLTAFDAFLDNGRRTFMETCWIPAFDNDCAAVFIRAMETAVSPGCAIFTHEFKGAAACVSAEATAFGLRRDHVLIEILATCDEVDEQPHRQWASATRRAFEAMALPGGYPNLLAASDVDRAGRSYGPNAGRLVKAKRIYDPDNIFSSAIPLPAGENGDGRKRLASAR